MEYGVQITARAGRVFTTSSRMRALPQRLPVVRKYSAVIVSEALLMFHGIGRTSFEGKGPSGTDYMTCMEQRGSVATPRLLGG